MNDVAQTIIGIIGALVGAVATIASAIALLRRSGYGRDKEDARELAARSAHQRILLRVIRQLRDILAGCDGCNEPEGLDDQIKWDYEREEDTSA